MGVAPTPPWRQSGRDPPVTGSVLRPCPQDTSSQILSQDSVSYLGSSFIMGWRDGLGWGGWGAGGWEMPGDRTPEPGPQESKVFPDTAKPQPRCSPQLSSSGCGSESQRDGSYQPNLTELSRAIKGLGDQPSTWCSTERRDLPRVLGRLERPKWW